VLDGKGVGRLVCGFKLQAKLLFQRLENSWAGAAFIRRCFRIGRPLQFKIESLFA